MGFSADAWLELGRAVRGAANAVGRQPNRRHLRAHAWGSAYRWCNARSLTVNKQGNLPGGDPGNIRTV
jgi:hypothetical protein